MLFQYKSAKNVCSFVAKLSIGNNNIHLCVQRLIIISLVVLITGCLYAPDDKINKGKDEQLDSGRWALNRIAIGDSMEMVKSEYYSKYGWINLEEIDEDGNKLYSIRHNSDLYVKFDSENLVVEVDGDVLYHNGKVIFVHNFSEEIVKQSLGKGYKVRKYKSKSGMYPSGYYLDDTTYFFNDGVSTQLVIKFKAERENPYPFENFYKKLRIRKWNPGSSDRYSPIYQRTGEDE